ncbi:acetylornithine transaminase [Propionibacteriaceae bacterium Y1700]|uniref:acetylornithine transaminase n=1 Tax=Microlunatus sp. Y1700 TaxID=3418487 RepID=UPI003DA76F76
MSENELELHDVGSQASVLTRYTDAMINTFGPPKRVFVRGEGVHVWDADGRKYLDLLSGLAVLGLGHAHPLVTSAIMSQLSTLGHVSNFFATPAQVELAERLTGFVGEGAKVFFANSGTEANEAAFKITRRTGRRRIISTVGAFHGRSMGALALTHNPKYREPFEPLPGDVTFVEYGDLDALAAAVDESVAAVILEPIQGENGVIVPADDYVTGAREITREHGALLWIDEVQTGIGRTGDWLAHRPGGEGIVADIVTVAKGLGNGFPIGACLATGRAADLLQPGAHGTTFGGNPVAAMAGLAVLSAIERDGLLAHVRTTGEAFAQQLRDLGHPAITEVRGRGFLLGVVLTDARAAAVSDLALDAGFVINAPRPDVLRLAPPLITTAEQLGTFVSALPGLLDAAGEPS